MLSILIVDDDKDVRETLKEAIELELQEGAAVGIEAIEPLPNTDEYAAYVREHDVSALILDERLDERPLEATGKSASYRGHEAIAGIRKVIPDFPVFVITTHAGDDELRKVWGEFEGIFDRAEFRKEAPEYTKMILRAAGRFHESMESQLALMGSLALKAVTDDLSDEERTSLAAVRELLGLPYAISEDVLMSDLVKEAQVLTKQSQELMAKLQAKNGT